MPTKALIILIVGRRAPYTIGWDRNAIGARNPDPRRLPSIVRSALPILKIQSAFDKLVATVNFLSTYPGTIIVGYVRREFHFRRMTAIQGPSSLKCRKLWEYRLSVFPDYSIKRPCTWCRWCMDYSGS